MGWRNLVKKRKWSCGHRGQCGDCGRRGGEVEEVMEGMSGNGRNKIKNELLKNS